MTERSRAEVLKDEQADVVSLPQPETGGAFQGPPRRPTALGMLDPEDQPDGEQKSSDENEPVLEGPELLAQAKRDQGLSRFRRLLAKIRVPRRR